MSNVVLEHLFKERDEYYCEMATLRIKDKSGNVLYDLGINDLVNAFYAGYKMGQEGVELKTVISVVHSNDQDGAMLTFPAMDYLQQEETLPNHVLELPEDKQAKDAFNLYQCNEVVRAISYFATQHSGKKVHLYLVEHITKQWRDLLLQETKGAGLDVEIHTTLPQDVPHTTIDVFGHDISLGLVMDNDRHIVKSKKRQYGYYKSSAGSQYQCACCQHMCWKNNQGWCNKHSFFVDIYCRCDDHLSEVLNNQYSDIDKLNACIAYAAKHDIDTTNMASVDEFVAYVSQLSKRNYIRENYPNGSQVGWEQFALCGCSKYIMGEPTCKCGRTKIVPVVLGNLWDGYVIDFQPHSVANHKREI